MRAGQRNLWPTHSERGLYGHLLVYERGKWSSACGVLAPGTRSAWGPHVTSHTRPGRPSPAPPSVCSWAGRGVMAAGSTGLAQGPLRRPFIRGQPLLRQSHLFPKNSRTCPTPLAFTSFHCPFWSCCCFPGPGSARHPWVPCTFAQISLVAPCWSIHCVHTHMYTHICTHTALPAPAPLSVWYFPPFSRIDQLYLLPPGWKIKSRGFIPCEPQTTVATQYLIYAVVQSPVTWCLPRRLYLQVSWRRGGLGRGAGEKLQGTESSPRVCPKDALTAHSVPYRKGGVSRSPRPGGAVELLTVDLTRGNQN